MLPPTVRRTIVVHAEVRMIFGSGFAGQIQIDVGLLAAVLYQQALIDL
jgi:hypothetical protein